MRILALVFFILSLNTYSADPSNTADYNCAARNTLTGKTLNAFQVHFGGSIWISFTDAGQNFEVQANSLVSEDNQASLRLYLRHLGQYSDKYLVQSTVSIHEPASRAAAFNPRDIVVASPEMRIAIDCQRSDLAR